MKLLFDSTIGLGKDTVAVGGTAGVGKTTCIGYFVFRILVLHLQAACSSGPAFFSDRVSASGDLVVRLILESKVEPHFDVMLTFNLIEFSVDIVDNTSEYQRPTLASYCFIDGYRRRIQPVEARGLGKVVAVFASPACEGHFHGKDGGDYRAYANVNLPTWSLADATAALQHQFSVSAIEHAVAIFGGSLRNILLGLEDGWNFKEPSVIDSFRSSPHDTCKAVVFACDTFQLYLSGKLFALFGDALTKTESVVAMSDAQYGSLFVHLFVVTDDLVVRQPAFASPFTQVLVTRWCWSAGVDKIDRFIGTFGSSPFGKSFELFVHSSVLSLPPGPLWTWTSKRGRIKNTKTEQLFPPDFDPLHRPAVIFFDSLASLKATVAQLVAQSRCAYIVPVNPDNRLFEAVLVDASGAEPTAYLLQHKVASEYDIASVWVQVRAALYPCALRLIFIIPFDKDWRQPPRMMNLVPDDVQQFYLPCMGFEQRVAVGS